MNINILIVGVGGQGTLLASKILGNYATLINKDCKLSEVHGMSQRGGSVVTYVRISDKVYSPLIDKKNADVILAFEELEALRWADYIKDGGMIIINKQNLYPMPVITGKVDYPADIYERVGGYGAQIRNIDALEIAMKLGDLRTVNVAVLGFCAVLLKFDREKFKEAIKNSVPASTFDINLRAFEEGEKRA
ncbi:MAG: indolepyruvate oxidoreductase subunit beta [Chitinispirillales bacterium]|jgi:indolepyruvate ferredoxin oxidoreductase beta subunit|nr:indolepyruvate oxidoreductase subunit beta [Chitinispirillales bacterium]